MSQEFAWEFYAGLATVIAERRKLEWLRVLPDAANVDADSVATIADTSADLARWDDDGGAPRC